MATVNEGRYARPAPKYVGRIFGSALIVGAAVALMASVYLGVVHLGIELLWKDLPQSFGGAKIVGLIVIALAALTIGWVRGQAGDDMSPEEEFAETGSISYKQVPRNAVLTFAALFSGASIGPEAGLGHFAGQLSSWLASLLRANAEIVRVLVIGGIAAAFGAYLGSPLVGVVVVLELYQYRKYDYAGWLLPAAASAGIAYALFWMLMGQPTFTVFAYPEFTEPAVRDALLAIPFGIVGALAAIPLAFVSKGIVKAAGRLRERPLLLALLGGLAIATALLVLPIVMFSGEEQIGTLLRTGTSSGVWYLAAVFFGKILLTVICFVTGFKGGPIFPSLFMGTAVGLFLAALLPMFSTPVIVVAVTTGFLMAIIRLPLSVILLMALISSIALSPIVIFAAISALASVVVIAPMSKTGELLRLIPG